MSGASKRIKEPSTPGPGWFRRCAGLTARLLWHVCAWIAAPLLIAGLAIRLTIRDEADSLAVLFYATPWAILWIMSVISLIYWWKLPRVRWVTLIVTAGCLAMWIVRGFGFAPMHRGTVESSFRITYWNVARPEWRLNSVLAQAGRMTSDFYVFGEFRPKNVVSPKWQEYFGSRYLLPLTRELLLVAPESVSQLDGGSLGGVGACQMCRAVVHGREVFLLLVDFEAAIGQSRRPGFDRLFQIVDAYSEKPLLVIGDFNTPSDSTHFDRLRSRLTSAFETAGRGYGATWPMPLPVMELDHIWTNKHLRVTQCEHATSFYSDHRAVVADIVFP
jgi:vancomycin resistance protein VanJ